MVEFGPAVLTFALARTGRRDEAEDIFQEVFVRAHLHRQDLGQKAHVKAWLLTVTANLCRDHARRMRRERAEPASLEILLRADPRPDPSREVARRSEGDRLLGAVRALPAAIRDTVILYYFDDLSVREISEVVRIRPELVKTRLYRGRARLRELLGEEGEGLER